MWRRRFVVGALIALAASGSFACSLLLGDDSPQCRVDNDCAARGFAGAVCVAEVCQPAPADAGIAVEASSDAGVDGDGAPPRTGPFACLGTVQRAEAGTGENVTLRVPVIDLVSGAPVPGLSAKVCRRLDVNCLSPITSVTGDDAGILAASVPFGFDGFFEVEKQGYCTALIYMETAVTAPTTRISANLAQPGIVTFLKEAAFPAADLEKGVSFISTLDCAGRLSDGVNVVSAEDASTTTIYLVNGTPSTKVDRTGGEGRAAVVDLVPGFSTVRCSVAADKARIGESAFSTRPFQSPTDGAPNRCFVTNAICAPAP